MGYHLTGTYDGYPSLVLAVGIESIGLPFPGQVTFLAAAIYAGATHRLNIALVIFCAAVGSTIGAAIGYWIGRKFGFLLLIRYGHLIAMTPPRIKLGQYLFIRYGAWLVLFGRFLPLLRGLVGFFSGANEMAWPRFALFNALGALLWAGSYGGIAFSLGHVDRHVLYVLRYALLALAVALTACGLVFVMRNEARLIALAEAALPGPLTATPWLVWRASHPRRHG